MVIPVRSSFIRTIVLLFGICPLWTYAVEQDGELQSYGPIVASDTLAEIAIKLKGDGPWHYQRWMYALYLKNPTAFFGNNINNLRMGEKLILPTEEELKQVDLAEAFRTVKIHLYVLEQERLENQESDDVQGGTNFAGAKDGESDEELLLRARLQRLFTSNEMMQKESGELYKRISSLEQQMGSVVDQVLDSEEREPQNAILSNKQMQEDNYQPPAELVSTTVVADGAESEGSGGWWFVLLSVALIYIAGLIWRRRLEAAL